MKKIILNLNIILLSAFLLSCNKEYTCECTSVEDGSSTVVKTTLTDTKKAAQKDCDEAAELNTTDKISTTCKIN